MAVQASGVATLLDVLATMAPDGKQMDIGEVLTQQNELLEDMTWREGNTVTGHRDAVRTSLPTPSFRAINEGVPVTKSGSTPIEETAALLEDFSRVDRELAILSGDVNAYRLREAKPHIIGMGHKMAQTVFYGNANIDPKGFTGLAPRYNSLPGGASNAGTNVIDAGGTGSNNRSIWLIKWDPDTITGIFPKGTAGGLDHEDATNASGTGAHGFPAAAALADASGNKFMGYEDHWIWRCGLMVKDWRYAVRIANIDPTLLTLSATTGPNLQDLLIQAQELIEDSAGAVFYMPRSLRAYFRRQMVEKKNAFLSWDEIGGKRVMTFGEAPIRRTDALNVAEARVV
jgi:hypothetical protein